MTTTALQKIRERIHKEKITSVALFSSDLRGNLRQLVISPDLVNANLMSEGVGFDGSSYGLHGVEASDYAMKPDLKTAHIDYFREEPTLCFFTTMEETAHGRKGLDIDPRRIAGKATAALRNNKIATDSMWGPEYEFYILSEVEYHSHERRSYYMVDTKEEFFQNPYHAAPPFDTCREFRDKAVSILEKYGIKIKYHHHEVGRMGQQEIEGLFKPLLVSADEAVLVKYILFNLAARENLHITFMPKPLYNQAGSGWHLHTYLVKNGKNAFYKKGAYANFNETALHYLGGILKHAPSLAAFTNAGTNSYKRLVPGFEAPVALTFARSNRSSAIRIPTYISDPQKTRFEYRPPDFLCNPYLCMAAIQMAGIDGVINKIDPRKEGFGPYDMNIFHDEEILSKVNFLPQNLGGALEALQQDNDYLMRDGVFTERLVELWVNLKQLEIKSIATRPHPFEYVMYFDF